MAAPPSSIGLVKFSILLEVQISEPTPEGERRLFHDCVEQAMLADELGYHRVWEIEHHGLYEYSHSSAPECLLSFVAARTKRIRIGHGVTLTPHRYNHPIRIAERVATLDILSERPRELGLGQELARGRAAKPSRSTRHAARRSGCEALEMIPRMWRSDVFEWKGRFFDIPPTRSCPSRCRSRTRRMFVACSQPRDGRARGQPRRRGAELRRRHRRRARREGRARTATPPPRRPETGRRVNNHFACTPTCVVLPDDRKACEHGFRGARFFARVPRHVLLTRGQRPVGALDVVARPLRPTRARGGDGRAQPRGLAARVRSTATPWPRARRSSASRRPASTS